MKKAPKILTVYYMHKPGGFCKRLQMKIEGYLEKGWEVHYVAVESFPYTHPKLFPHILFSPTRNYRSLFFWCYFFLTAPLYLVCIALKQRINMISVFSPVYACLCIPTKLILQIPILMFVRVVPNRVGSFNFTKKLALRVEASMEKLGTKFSDFILAASASARLAMIDKHGSLGNRIEVLPNNILHFRLDKKKFKNKLHHELSIRRDQFVIITTGLLIPRKNIEMILKALSLTTDSRATLLIVGNGNHLEILKRGALEAEISERAIFTGWREDVLEILQGSDLFVLASRQEGMSNSLLEAMACEIPCLVSDIPENREVLRNPEQHFPPDRPDILAEKITRLINDPDYYKQLLQATIEDKARFDFDWKKRMVDHASALLMNNQSGIPILS